MLGVYGGLNRLILEWFCSYYVICYIKSLFSSETANFSYRKSSYNLFPVFSSGQIIVLVSYVGYSPVSKRWCTTSHFFWASEKQLGPEPGGDWHSSPGSEAHLVQTRRGAAPLGLGDGCRFSKCCPYSFNWRVSAWLPLVLGGFTI